jgi:hypothetical protein
LQREGRSEGKTELEIKSLRRNSDNGGEIKREKLSEKKSKQKDK